MQFSLRSRPATAFEKEAVAASALLVMSFGAEQNSGAPRSSFHWLTAQRRGKGSPECDMADFPSSALPVPNPQTPLICTGASLHYCGLVTFCSII